MPFVLTPLNITVTRFAHAGMPVKSRLVPLVDACAVPLTIGASVPSSAASVWTTGTAVAGSLSVIDPPLAEFKTRLIASP